MAGSEATQAPLREHGKAHAKAKADVAKAERALVKASTSDRLDKAAAAKSKADQAVTDSAKEMGCRTHCRELLQKAVDDAAREVEAARKEIADNKAKAETALERAQVALARMKAPVSPTPLADLTGAPAWVLDLTIAILGSLGVNGLACCLLIFGAHGAHQRLVETARLEPIIDAKPADPPQRAKATGARRHHNARGTVCVGSAEPQRRRRRTRSHLAGLQSLECNAARASIPMRRSALL